MPTTTLQKRTTKAPSRRRPVWIVGALAAAAVLVIAVISLTGDDSEPTALPTDDDSVSISQTNDVTIDGDALPELQETETSQGAAAPQASGSTFTGESVALLESGTPTVIGFFAHWCPFCQSEVDELSKHLAATGLPDDVNIVAVSTSVDSSRPNFPPSAWFESEGWPTPVLSDDVDSTVARAYGLSKFPFWAIVDADGDLVSRTAGGIGPDQFDEFVELARAGV